MALHFIITELLSFAAFQIKVTNVSWEYLSYIWGDKYEAWWGFQGVGILCSFTKMVLCALGSISCCHGHLKPKVAQEIFLYVSVENYQVFMGLRWTTKSMDSMEVWLYIDRLTLVSQAETLKEENDSLRWQLDAYRNEVELLKQEQGKAPREDDPNKEQQLKLLQQALQGMQQVKALWFSELLGRLTSAPHLEKCPLPAKRIVNLLFFLIFCSLA